MRFNRDSVSQQSKDIFCHRLSEKDLEIFLSSSVKPPSTGCGVIAKDFIAEWIHHCLDNYFWQHKVSEWLKENCGIYKTQRDWGLDDERDMAGN